MKFALMLMLASSVAFASSQELYQVISQHPHDVEHIMPYIKTESVQGRLWVVSLKSAAPQKVMKYLRPMTKDISHFTPEVSSFNKVAPKPFIKEALKEVSAANLKTTVEKLLYLNSHPMLRESLRYLPR